MLDALQRIQRILQWMVLLFFGSTIFAVCLYKYCPVYVTPLMLIRCMQQVKRGTDIRMHHHWVPLDSISPHMPVAVMASEDQRFMEHWGLDMIQIRKAIKERESGKRRRGASTISQQTAKNVFLWPRSGWVRKGLEVYFTLLIETIWGKERIMEVYLNSIEMGDGIYGTEAAARWIFNRSSMRLTRANCALIAASLPNPLRMDSKRPSAYMLKRQSQIMREMNNIAPLWPSSR